MRFGAPSEGGSLKPQGLGDGPEQPQAQFVPGALNLCNPYHWEITRHPGNLGSDYCPSGSDSGEIELRRKVRIGRGSAGRSRNTEG